MQFAAAVKGFLEYCAVEKQLSQHTLDAYAGDLADFEKWLPSGTAVADISTATMKQYLEQLVVDRKLTSATVRRRGWKAGWIWRIFIIFGFSVAWWV